MNLIPLNLCKKLIEACGWDSSKLIRNFSTSYYIDIGDGYEWDFSVDSNHSYGCYIVYAQLKKFKGTMVGSRIDEAFFLVQEDFHKYGYKAKEIDYATFQKITKV